MHFGRFDIWAKQAHGFLDAVRVNVVSNKTDKYGVSCLAIRKALPYFFDSRQIVYNVAECERLGFSACAEATAIVIASAIRQGIKQLAVQFLYDDEKQYAHIYPIVNNEHIDCWIDKTIPYKKSFTVELDSVQLQ